MIITLDRRPSNDVCTMGAISVDGQFVCYTLEDIVRDEKIFGQTAIPSGTYPVAITYSPHFERDLPLLLNVPGYQGVRIHPGNTAADTEGCILPGRKTLGDTISQSRAAFDVLYPLIQGAIDAGEDVSITINNG
jgi:hypothetical protein